MEHSIYTMVRRACLKKQRLNSHVTLLGHSLHLCLVFLCRHTMHARLIIILQTFMLVFTTSSSFLLRTIFRENGLIQTYLVVQKKSIPCSQKNHLLELQQVFVIKIFYTIFTAFSQQEVISINQVQINFQSNVQIKVQNIDQGEN